RAFVAALPKDVARPGQGLVSVELSRSPGHGRILERSTQIGLTPAAAARIFFVDQQTIGGGMPAVPEGYSSRRVRAGALELHGGDGGAGDAMVLLHGWPATWWVWRKVMPTLAARYRVMAVDLPGLGESEPSPDGYDKRTVARHLHALLE